jgi:hypothetical protein
LSQKTKPQKKKTKGLGSLTDTKKKNKGPGSLTDTENKTHQKKKTNKKTKKTKKKVQAVPGNCLDRQTDKQTPL